MDFARDEIESRIRAYFDACNAADPDKIKSFFTDDAVHYFPEGGSFGALRGSQTIADCWVQCVNEFGSWWTVDHFVFDPGKKEAVIEWTHFKPKLNGYLRGDEWYRFDEKGLITEIRAYYACPVSQSVHEIGGYAYQELNYPMNLPKEAEGHRS